MLKICRITIKNFRQLEDIELKFSDDKGVFVFIGKNGIGKSNFLNAICWCLYEKQPFKSVNSDESSIDDDKILNENVARINPNAEVFVEIEVSMDGDIYFFKRKKTVEQEACLSVMRKVDSEWNIIDQPNVIVNNFLPESVRDFFVFDGEAVKNLFKGSYAKNIKEGIWRISHVKILDRSIDHLTKIGNGFRKELSKELPDEAVKEKEYSALNDRIEKNKKVTLSKGIELDKLKDKLSKLHKKESHFEKYRNLHEERSDVIKLLAITKRRKNEYQDDINSLIVAMSPFYYMQESLIEIGDLIKQDTKKGQVPPSIKSKFIEELLSTKMCICGNDVIKGHSEHKKLTDLLNEVTPMDGRDILLEDGYLIDQKNRALKDFKNQFGDLREKRARERKNIDTYERKISDIKEQLKNAPEQEVGNLEATIQKAEEQVEDIQREIGGVGSELKIDSIKEADLKKEIDRLIERRTSNTELSKKYTLVNESVNKLTIIREKLINRTRATVSKNTDKFFKEMIWKKEEFEKIQYNADYEVSVYKKGSEMRMSVADLSTGEMKVLGFATLKALAMISGFSIVPSFIDGPLEYLDNEVQSIFLEQLPDFMPDKQVFIFSLDSPAMLKFAKEKVKKENFYHVTRDDDSTSTSIINYTE